MTDWQFPPALWDAIGLTLRLAAVTSVVLLIVGIPLANWLNNSKMRGIIFVETLVSLPIVLPPTVIGFYLLMLMAPQQPLGAAWMSVFGHPLPFSFAGLVAGSVLYSLPFAVQPFQAAFRGVGRDLVQSALALGLTRRQTFYVDRAAAVETRDSDRRVAQLCAHDGGIRRRADAGREHPGPDPGRLDRALR